MDYLIWLDTNIINVAEVVLIRGLLGKLKKWKHTENEKIRAHFPQVKK